MAEVARAEEAKQAILDGEIVKPKEECSETAEAMQIKGTADRSTYKAVNEMRLSLRRQRLDLRD